MGRDFLVPQVNTGAADGVLPCPGVLSAQSCSSLKGHITQHGRTSERDGGCGRARVPSWGCGPPHPPQQTPHPELDSRKAPGTTLQPAG